MSKWIEVHKKSVLPWYLASAVWLVAALVLPIYNLWALLAAAAVTLAAFGAARKFCPDVVSRKEVPFMTGREDVDAMLALIDQKRIQLQQLNHRIQDPELSAAMDRMEAASQGILQEVEQHPEKAAQVRRFANYYLQDAVKVLTLYAELDEKGIRGEHSQQVRQQVARNAQAIATAFENQLDGLFAQDVLDISTDLEVLNGILKGQGLLQDQ